MNPQPIDDDASAGSSDAGLDQEDDKPKKPMNLLDPNDQPLDSSKPSDANLLWVYLAVALANIALFAGAFWLYKRFVQRRMAARQQARDNQRDDDLSL